MSRRTAWWVGALSHKAGMRSPEIRELCGCQIKCACIAGSLRDPDLVVAASEAERLHTEKHVHFQQKAKASYVTI